jgi:hypothetical protein
MISSLREALLRANHFNRARCEVDKLASEDAPRFAWFAKVTAQLVLAKTNSIGALSRQLAMLQFIVGDGELL